MVIGLVDSGLAPESPLFAGIPGLELAGLVACEAVVVLRHRDNILRLVRGQEGTLRP